MSSKPCRGQCLCQQVEYEISGNMGIFQYCHCSRCRRVTGSAHASNLFVKPEQFKWIKGESLVQRYAPKDAKHFATCFCQQCGSNLPWLASSGKVVVVPAGTLLDDPHITPSQHIFWHSKACWFSIDTDLPQHQTLPGK